MRFRIHYGILARKDRAGTLRLYSAVPRDRNGQPLPPSRDSINTSKFSGDVVEADEDLCALHNLPGQMPRYERLPDGPVGAAASQGFHRGNENSMPGGAAVAVEEAEDNLESLTLSELKSVAATEEIDTGEARTKAEIVAKIRASR